MYEKHSMSVKVPHLDFDVLSASTATYYCPVCGYEEERPYLLSTEGIQDDLYKAFREKSTRSISLNNDVLHTPDPVNFQLRVDPAYLVGGPDDNTYAIGHGGYNRYYSKGYAAAAAYTYDGDQNDYFSFGVIRAGSGYRGWARVQLKAPSNENYVFKRWEMYDWATETWTLFSTDPTPEFNNVTDEIDTRVNDLTILRAVCEYVEPEKYTVTVVGGTYHLSGDWDHSCTEGTVDAGAGIYLDYDESAVPEGKCFDHYDVYAGEELIGTTDGWDYAVDRDGLVFKAVYIDQTYWLDVRAEYGYVYLVSGGDTVVGKDKDGGKGKEGDDGREEYWGGEYPAGTQITVTTESENEEEYPYFLGWYYVTYTEMGEDRDFLTADSELTITVTARDDKDDYGAYVAVWSPTPEAQENTEYRTLTVTNGFASVRQMRDGLYLNVVRVPYYSTVSFREDPGLLIDAEKWTVTGTFEDESEYNEEPEIDCGTAEMWLGGEGDAPAELTATVSGVSNAIFGDSNGDGCVEITDATRIQRVLADYDDDMYGRANVTSDLSGSGDVDIIDVTLLQRYLVDYEVPNADRIGKPVFAAC